MNSGSFSHSVEPPLIMVVDDEKTLRLLLCRAMQQDGYEVMEVRNGEDCLKQCHPQTGVERLPDIILLDAVMPEIDGFECCQRLQEMLGMQTPLVLMITALNDQQWVDRAFAAGATDYITKPVHWAVLRHRVRRLLQGIWAAREQERLLVELRATMAHERLLKEQLEQANQKLEQANQQLAYLACVDGVTQISNRRYFDERFQQEWQRILREQLPLSIILIDIDHFKEYNDTYGHLLGDEVLRQVAQLLHSIAQRPADFAARFGGEEFVVVLPNTNAAGATSVATSIQQLLEKKAIAHNASTTSSFLTVSMGVASAIPPHHGTPSSLIDKADQMLYMAKQNGRNRFETAIVFS